MDCIVHYPNLATYTLEDLSDNIINRVNLAKEKRSRLGGHNHHSQCDNLPDVISQFTLITEMGRTGS